MKKSTLLSLATAGAIVATSVGTFAAWDQMSIEKQGTVEISKPVTMTMDDLATFTASRQKGELNAENAPTYSQDVTFNVTNVPTEAEENYEIKVEAKVYDKGTSNVATNINAVATPAEGDATTVSGAHKYTVTVTPDENVTATEYDVKVTASIEAKVKQ